MENICHKIWHDVRDIRYPVSHQTYERWALLKLCSAFLVQLYGAASASSSNTNDSQTLNGKFSLADLNYGKRLIILTRPTRIHDRGWNPARFYTAFLCFRDQVPSHRPIGVTLEHGIFVPHCLDSSLDSIHCVGAHYSKLLPELSRNPMLNLRIIDKNHFPTLRILSRLEQPDPKSRSLSVLFRYATHAMRSGPAQHHTSR